MTMNMLRPLKKVASSAKARDTKQADNKQASSSFLKKKNQKTFPRWRADARL
jgi:hypothetical protein